MYKKVKIISAIITISLTFLFHFMYDLVPNVFTASFSLINESIAEHLKLFVTPALIAFIVEMLIMKYKRICIQNNYLALLVEILSSIGLFMLIFSPVYFLIGENLIFNIILMIISIIFSKYLGYLLVKEKNELILNLISIPIILIIVLMQIIFTFNPPNNSLFIDPITGETGYKHEK